jgi:AraC-like DNA-binding protein
MDYTQSIQTTVTYIDQHLCEKLTLAELSRVAGFSKYHLLRIFKYETGKGIWEYIQMRRMMQAAKLLLSTEVTILEIALIYQFESQEAFTRAFKREYSLPPGRYRRTMSSLINVKEESLMKPNSLIPGWIVTGSAPKAYVAMPDPENDYHNAKSIIIKNKAVMIEPDSFCTVMQQFRATNYLGKRVRFSGYIKSQEVKSWGGLWMRINNSTAGILKIDNMQNRPISGDCEWSYYSVVLDVPESSAIINIGLLLNGSGKLLLSNVSFETVGLDVCTTDVDLSCNLPEDPVNLSFDVE